MPVRSLSSSVFKWPNAETTLGALKRWAERIGRENEEVIRIGCFGSYARGDWGVGSDLDVIVILKRSDLPFERRAVGWDTTELPVPVDLLIYTEEEWESLKGGTFHRRVSREIIWVFTRPTPSPS